MASKLLHIGVCDIKIDTNFIDYVITLGSNVIGCLAYVRTQLRSYLMYKMFSCCSDSALKFD